MIKVGLIQFEPKLGKPVENISTLQGLLERAHGADLIVLPELSNSGYNFESRMQAFELSEEIKSGDYTEFLTAQAKKNNEYFVSGINERAENKLFNSSILVGPNGLIGTYRKIHLFMNEKDIFEKGDLELKVFDLGFCKTGMLICFDWIFPEVWRILALKGADVICHPSNLVLPYAQQAVPVHGMINRTFNITANRIGTEKSLTFTGQSFISDPSGTILKMASLDKAEIILVDIDPQKARNKMITERNHAFNDRIPSAYTFLTQN
jgi:predicted amidohydrolase